MTWRKAQLLVACRLNISKTFRRFDLKAIFVHDHRFFVNETREVFSSGKLPYSVWQRYLKFFDELIVVGRSAPIKNMSLTELDLSSGEKVSFVFMPNLAHPWNMLRYRSEVVKSLTQQIQNVDAVIARSSLLGRLAASIAIRLGKPWAIEVVGCSWDALWNYGNLTGRLYAPLAWLGQRMLVKRAPFAIYVTQKFLQRRYPCQGITAGVSNVNVPKSDGKVLEQRFQRVNQPGKPFVFGLIGSLNSKYKGIQTALESFQAIREQLPEFELRVLGGGDASYWIRLAASHGLENCVKFVGTLPAGEAVLQWLDQVDVYLQPSFTEGLPRSLVEAMSRGCPAIGSTAGGIPELLESGVLHKPGDVKQLGRLILSSLDTQWRFNQAKRNFETAKLYSKELLDHRRDRFWQSFAEHALKQQRGLS